MSDKQAGDPLFRIDADGSDPTIVDPTAVTRSPTSARAPNDPRRVLDPKPAAAEIKDRIAFWKGVVVG